MRAILLAILSLASATGLFAQNADQGPTVQPSPGFQSNERRGPWPQLNLTEDQKAKLKEIRESDNKSLKSAIEQVRTARESLQSALLANPENTADIQAKATSLGNAESAVTVQRALQEAKINEVLTPAQRTILDASRKERQQRRRPGPRNQEQVPNQD
jgi:Spy/CpxP family protein refolding chaperone